MKFIVKQGPAYIIVFFLTLSMFSSSAFASIYGEGSYGVGTYNQGSPTSSGILNPSGSSSNVTSAPGCNDRSPMGKPDLFQIDRLGNQAKLYFTPVNDSVESYHVIFGFYDGDERFGGINMKAQNENQGVQSMVIDHIKPRASYSFKVVSVNGCAPGDWSNWLQAGRLQAKTSIYYRYWDKVKNIFK